MVRVIEHRRDAEHERLVELDVRSKPDGSSTPAAFVRSPVPHRLGYCWQTSDTDQPVDRAFHAAVHKRQNMGARPLTDAEYDRLAGVLNQFRGEHAMNLEELDGFFAALICGPNAVHPSEYLPEIWGGEMADEEAFSSREQLKEFLDLIMRHWNVIADTLQSGDVFLPLLLQDDHGVSHANDWAQGFVRGMALRRADWSELLNSEEHGGWLVPILALAHEHDPDPTMRPYQEPMDAERREQLIVGIAAGVTAIYRYFEPRRRMLADLRSGQSTYRRTARKIGRNDPCACGSGKKYKHCCGKPTLH